jgi:hypothetical protein
MMITMLTMDDRLRNYARQNYGYLLRGADWDGDIRLILECEGISPVLSGAQARRTRSKLNHQINAAQSAGERRKDAEKAAEGDTKPATIDVTAALRGGFTPMRGTPWMRNPLSRLPGHRHGRG